MCPNACDRAGQLSLDFLRHFTYILKENSMSDMDMTPAEQNLADDRMRAEIAKLLAETMNLRTQKIWYPVFVAGTLLAGGAGALALILRLTGAI